MSIGERTRVDPISQRPYTRIFTINRVYRWMIGIVCGYLVLCLLVLILAVFLNPFLSRPPLDWGVLLATAALASAMLLGSLVYFTKLSRLAVMLNDEGIWLSGRDDPDFFVPWGKIEDVRERVWAPGWVLLDGQGQTLLSIDCELGGFEELHAILREHTRIPFRMQTEVGLVWMSRGYAAVCLGMAALGVLGGWVAWNEGLAGNWWFALSAVALPSYALFAVVQLRIEPDALVLRRPLWTRQIPRDAIASIQMTTSVFGPVVALECKGNEQNIMLEHLNLPAHELFEMLTAWSGNESKGLQEDGKNTS